MAVGDSLNFVRLYYHGVNSNGSIWVVQIRRKDVIKKSLLRFFDNDPAQARYVF